MIWGQLIFTLMHFSSSHPYKMKKRIVPNPIIYQTFISDLGPLSETSMKVEKKSELIGRGGGFYRRPVMPLCHRKMIELKKQNLSFGSDSTKYHYYL